MKEKSPEMESDRGQRGKRGVGECVLCFVLRTTSVSPLDRDKDRVLDPRKMPRHFSVCLRRGIKNSFFFGRRIANVMMEGKVSPKRGILRHNPKRL